MGTVDLDYLKQGFASLVQQAKHTTLPTFILWLDLKVAEYKVNGYMMLDEGRTGEDWIKFLQRCQIHPQGGYPGYHVHANNPFVYTQGPGLPDQPSGGQTPENIHPGRRSESADRIHALRPAMPDPGDPARPNESPHVVQIKPEPTDMGFERLQQDIRQEQRNQQSYYTSGVLRRSMEYPIVPETSQQAMDMNRRDKILPLPLDYPGHTDRNMLTQNHEGPEPMQTEYLQNNERNREIIQPDHPLSLIEQAGGREPDGRDGQLPTSESGFFKMTTGSSGIPVVNRQTANRCPVCNRIFHYYSSFNRHMKLHQGVFTHICEVCRRKFTRKEHFVRHKCHRRPNKPSRMADLNEGDTSLGGTGEPLIQAPPTSNEPSPREVSIPPPLIHISDMPTTNMSAQRTAFTYDPHPFSDSSLVPISSHMDTTHTYSITAESEHRPPVVTTEISTNNKHRRKTTTPMKVEAFMEPPPSLDTPGEMSLGRSTEDITEALEKTSPGNSTGECPTVTYRRASSSDLCKASSATGEFSNISRPESRNSEPTQSSHYGNYDPPLEPDEKNFSERPQRYSGPLRDDQYPVLKRKVLEAASSLSHLENDMNNCNDAEDEGRKGSQSREGSEGQGSVEQYGGSSGGAPPEDEDEDETQPTDLSATGTPTGQLSQGPSSPSGPDTASTTGANTPTGFVPTPPSSDAAPTPSSATALSPYGSQPGEGQGLDLMEQHISSQGPVKESSLSLNTSLSMPSAYAPSEPSSPADRAKQQQQGDINCPSCNKRFLHLSSLNRHMKLHQGIFTHACAVCGRKFTRKEHFVNHKCSRRPRNPTRVMATMEQESLHGQPQKVEYPPSMALSKQPSPPGAPTWDAGSLSMSSGGGIASPLASPLASPIPLSSSLMPQAGPSVSSESNSPSLPPSSPEHRRMWKWKSKWQ